MPAPVRGRLHSITLWGAIYFVACFAWMTSSAQGQQQSPNVVFVLADDLGWSNLSCYGSEVYCTEHIDALADTGMRFTDAYSGAPNCSPTRACLMTGQYTPRHGVYTNKSGTRGPASHRTHIGVENRTSLETRFSTLAEHFQQAGYTTCHLGKWHLGDDPVEGPGQQGFDINIAGSSFGAPKSGYFSPYHLPMIEDGPRGEYLTDRLTSEALSFLDEHAEQPFFLYLAHYTVHTPMHAPSELIDLYRDRIPEGGLYNATHVAMAHSLDDSVGQVIAKLEELQIRENTIVVFYSDNGGSGGYDMRGVRGGSHYTTNLPLRGGKGMLYEGGIRVPLIVSWPGHVAAGTECSEPVTSVDFFPTLHALTSIENELPTVLDGVDITPLLQSDGSATLDRDAIFWHFPGYLQLGSTPGRWRTLPVGVIRQGEWKLMEFFEDMHVELYNLNEDLSETNECAEENPEIAAQLTERLHAWREATDAPMPTPIRSE